MTGSNYIESLMAHPGFGLGGVHDVQVLHDDWCDFLRTGGKMPCNCDPELVVKRLDEALKIEGERRRKE